MADGDDRGVKGLKAKFEALAKQNTPSQKAALVNPVKSGNRSFNPINQQPESSEARIASSDVAPKHAKPAVPLRPAGLRRSASAEAVSSAASEAEADMKKSKSVGDIGETSKKSVRWADEHGKDLTTLHEYDKDGPSSLRSEPLKRSLSADSVVTEKSQETAGAKRWNSADDLTDQKKSELEPRVSKKVVGNPKLRAALEEILVGGQKKSSPNSAKDQQQSSTTVGKLSLAQLSPLAGSTEAQAASSEKTSSVISSAPQAQSKSIAAPPPPPPPIEGLKTFKPTKQQLSSPSGESQKQPEVRTITKSGDAAQKRFSPDLMTQLEQKLEARAQKSNGSSQYDADKVSPPVNTPSQSNEAGRAR